jgi:hypothetical protein
MAIGCIILVTSGALLLHNMPKLVSFLRRKSVEVVQETGAGGRPQQRQGQLLLILQTAPAVCQVSLTLPNALFSRMATTSLLPL